MIIVSITFMKFFKIRSTNQNGSFLQIQRSLNGLKWKTLCIQTLENLDTWWSRRLTSPEKLTTLTSWWGKWGPGTSPGTSIACSPGTQDSGGCQPFTLLFKLCHTENKFTTKLKLVENNGWGHYTENKVIYHRKRWDTVMLSEYLLFLHSAK